MQVRTFTANSAEHAERFAIPSEFTPTIAKFTAVTFYLTIVLRTARAIMVVLATVLSVLAQNAVCCCVP